MKKQILSVVMAAVLTVSALAVTTKTTTAAQMPEGLEAKIEATAGYMMTDLANKLAQEGYKVSYTDYQDATVILKAGAKNVQVVEKLNAELKAQLDAYNPDTFLNPYGSAGVQSLTYATAILYLEEQGEDVKAYDTHDLVSKLETIFTEEAEPNPYAYQYVAAVADNTKGLSANVTAKIKEGVLSYYVAGDKGTGIDYWGVSADNNGSVLTALVSQYKTDADIQAKVDAAIAWNGTQKDATGAITSWGSANASSTAMAMSMAARFGKFEEAKSYYDAMVQFESQAGDGAYTYMGDVSAFSTRDALTGLLAYRNGLAGKSLFAVTERPVQPTATPAPVEPSKAPVEPSKAPAVTTAPGQNAEADRSDAPKATQPATPEAPATAPKTGDTANVATMIVCMGACLAVITAVKSRKVSER